MISIYRKIAALVMILMLAAASVWAAPAGGQAIQKIRYSQAPDKVRIVFDLNSPAEHTVKLLDDPLRLVVDIKAPMSKTVVPHIAFNDPFVAGIRISEIEPGVTRAVIDFKMAVIHRVYPLASPDRLVVDLVKVYEQKIHSEVMPGLKYTSWLRGQPHGPVWAHILDIDPRAGFVLVPVLSNDIIPGLETVQEMSVRTKAAGMINASYFSKTGEILGILKLDGKIASTSPIPRSTLGIMPDGRIIMNQIGYHGAVEVSDGRTFVISGVNRERGEDELILYNSFYGSGTNTNNFGIELTVQNGKVTSVSSGSSAIPPGGVVLSAHGSAAKALTGIKAGDAVKITETLGPEFDKALYAIGAGPMLIRNNSIYLTTKLEEFGSDVAGGRAPRTAVGVTKDGRILLVVVDGRQPSSTGLTLLELALLMQELGAVDAMNLDGGGSSQMAVNDKLVNKPSDGRERKVGTGLAVISAKVAN